MMKDRINITHSFFLPQFDSLNLGMQSPKLYVVLAFLQNNQKHL
jgi:hypothetical protein